MPRTEKLAEYLLHYLSYRFETDESRGDNAKTKTRGSKERVERQDIEVKKVAGQELCTNNGVRGRLLLLNMK
jgi:hypothetical protein